MASIEKARGLVGQNRHADIEQGHVDVLAHAGTVAHFECGEDGRGRINAGEQVGERHAHALRTAAGDGVRAAGDAHHATHGLDHQVVAGALGVGPILAKAGDRAVNEARVEGFEALKIQPVSGQPAHLEVLHQDVAVLGHLTDERLAFNLGHVDGDGAFVAVASGEVSGVFGVVALGILEERGTPMARVIASAGTLDLDDVGAKVGQNLGAPRAGQDAGEVEYFEVGEGCGLCCHRLLLKE